MQPIDRPGGFLAEWGAFVVHLDNGRSRCLADIRRRDDGAVVATMPELPVRTSREAIEWAARQLEERGAVAFVDGRRRALVDYLVFVEDPHNTR